MSRNINTLILEGVVVLMATKHLYEFLHFTLAHDGKADLLELIKKSSYFRGNSASCD